MEVHMRYTSFTKHLLEHPQEVIRIEVSTMQIRKHQITIFPSFSLLKLLFQLLYTMLLEHINEERRQAHQTLTRRRLRLRLDIPIFRDIIHCVKHKQRL